MITERSYDAAGRVTAIRNEEGRGWGGKQSLKSLAYLYNPAGERTFQVEDNGWITAYSYDELGRVAGVQYPWMSGKKLEDFRERLELGLYPAYEREESGSRGRGRTGSSEGAFRFDLPQPHIQGFERQELEEALKGLLSRKEEIFKAYGKPGFSGRWQVRIGEGATEFASTLELAPETAEGLSEAYRQIASPYHRPLDTRQWMWTESYSYDERSNRIWKANGWGRIEYSYDPADRILSAGKRAYEHDANGNLTKESLGDIEGTYTYSPENRVVEIYGELPGFLGSCDWSLEGGVRYEYDALGRRSSRVQYVQRGLHERSWSKDSQQSYLYEGLSFQVLAELHDTEYSPPGGYGPSGRGGWNQRSKGAVKPISEYLVANGDILSRTDFQEQGSGWGDWQARWKNKEYYGQDVLGSVILLTDSRGQVRESYSYDAFGSRYGDGGPREGRPPGGKAGSPGWPGWPERGVNPYGYNGKRYDAAVGLYDYGFRDYKLQLGRWTTLDPIKDSYNSYVYVHNDPINFLDLAGLAEIYADDIYGNPIVAWPTRDLKADTSIEIQRTDTEAYYEDVLKIKIGTQTLTEKKVQSEADYPGYEHQTLKAGEYTGYLLEETGSYKEPILLVNENLGAKPDDYFLIHPDQYTNPQKVKKYTEQTPPRSVGPWSQPYGQGCQIAEGLKNYNEIVDELKGIGFEFSGRVNPVTGKVEGYKDTVPATIKDPIKNK